MLTLNPLKKASPSPRQRPSLGAHRGSRPLRSQAICPYGCLQRYPLSTWSPMTINPSKLLLLPACSGPGNSFAAFGNIGPILLPLCQAEALSAETPNLKFCLRSRALFPVPTRGKISSLSHLFSSPLLPGGIFSSDGSPRHFLLCFESPPFP